MIRKLEEKAKAILFRKQGKTYSEILQLVPVAKSTLGIWLKEAKISKAENQRFTVAKKLASLRGGQAKREQRVEKQNKILTKARSQILQISQYELFLIGIILYWAEGAKEKEYKPGSAFEFTNMDPKIIRVLLIWLSRVCKIDRNMIVFNIFLHQNHTDRVAVVRKYWSKITGFPIKSFSTIYWKKIN